MVAILVLLGAAVILGLATACDRLASGQYWWVNPSDVVAVCFIGIPVSLMFSGIVVYAALN